MGAVRRLLTLCRLLCLFAILCSPGCLSFARPLRLLPVAVQYLPHLVKTAHPSFSTARVLVLQPIDNRAPYPIRKGSLPAVQDNIAILGIAGTNSQEGTVAINSSRLGAQRYMVAGIKQNPDRPRGIYALTGLSQLVQEALVSHFQETGLTAHKVSFSTPQGNGEGTDSAQYAVGCEIEKFTLVSLERHHEMQIDLPTGSHTTYIPVRGPTRAEVSLKVTLYRWPAGDILWDNRIAAAIDDPPLKEREFLYATPGEVASMALSRAVGSILVSQDLQDALAGRRVAASQ